MSCFAALGLALAAFSPTGDSAPAIANATILPLAFVSNVFLNTDNAPEWIQTIGNIFPLKHWVNTMQDAFSPFTTDAAWRWDDIGVMVAWGILGAALALRHFKWEPRAESAAGTKRTRRRRSEAKAPV